MNIGFVAPSDPLDKRSWSGIYYSLFKAIEKRGFNVIPLPMHYTKNQMRLVRVCSMINSVLFPKKQYNPFLNFVRAHSAARYYSKKINEHKLDLIFAPVSAAEIALLKTPLPIIYLSDSSFNQIIEYYSYPFYKNLSSLSLRESNWIEKKALQNCRYLIYSSKWAADYAIDFYKLNPERIRLTSFGANIDAPAQPVGEKNYDTTINFLFLGVDWVRKGGEIALRTIEMLHSRGYNVKLIVCGCIPPEKNDLVEVIPFLNKNNQADNLKLINLLAESHFLFVPTRADCTPIVFCEAAAYSLPVITTDTGGVRSIIEEGVNGYALPLDATAEDYAGRIAYLLNSPEKITAICKSARVKYEKELNWDNFGEIFELLAKGRE